MLNINYVTGFNTQDDRVVDGQEFIIDLLQHGSGIDSNWSIHKPKNGRYVYFGNSYHCMDDNGFYCGYQDFSVILPAVIVDHIIKVSRYHTKTELYNILKISAGMFTLQFNGDRYLSEYYALRDYLTDTVYHALYFAE